MDVLQNDVWDFYVKGNREERRLSMNLTGSQWSWMVKLQSVLQSQYAENIKKRSIDVVFLNFPLRTSTFELEIIRTHDFPKAEPTLKGSFIEGFHMVSWCAQRDLLNLIENYYEFCQVIDNSIMELKDAQNEGFELIEVCIDEDDEECLFAKLYVEMYKEEISLSISFENPTQFPKKIRISNQKRVREFNCERWIDDERLGKNLIKFYIEDSEPNNDEIKKVVEVNYEKEEDDDKDDMLDFL